METHEQRLAAYEAQLRAKYSEKQRQKMAGKEAMPDGSYPIADAEDLDNAIHAVGRGTNNSHNTIRRHIIARAKALGLSSRIPDNWGADGSLTDANAAELDAEDRDKPTSEDYSVSYGLKNAKQALAGVKADQLADPNNKTDPDDEAVMSAIEEAEAALDRAIVAQGKDSKYEPARSSNPATPKRAFSSLVEQAPAQVRQLEIRMEDTADPNVANFRGYAYTIDERYGVRDWLGEYKESIGPGASSKTLREQDAIPFLFNHDGLPMANTSSRTSQLSDDGKGLLNLAMLDRRQGLTNDICIALARGDLNKMSFSFRAIVEDWNDAYDDRYVRELQLYDTSIVTYPANSATSAELVDAMRSAMGREGRSLWLAEHELSVRSALPVFTRGGATELVELDADESDLVERALRALAHADETVCRSRGPHGRARTFLVAGALGELRAGKVLSAKNQGLLQTALDALSAADRQHQKVAGQHAKAADAVSSVLNSQDGEGDSTPPANGEPIMPQDGAGARSRALRLRRDREREIRQLRRA